MEEEKRQAFSFKQFCFFSTVIEAKQGIDHDRSANRSSDGWMDGWMDGLMDVSVWKMSLMRIKLLIIDGLLWRQASQTLSRTAIALLLLFSMAGIEMQKLRSSGAHPGDFFCKKNSFQRLRLIKMRFANRCREFELNKKIDFLGKYTWTRFVEYLKNFSAHCSRGAFL